jgi:uncharacterized protein (DUF3820 family)
MTSKTLDELRNWLAGDTVEGLPYRELPDALDELITKAPESGGKKRGVDGGRMTKASRGRYEPLSDGNDAKLLFGRYSGRSVSSLANSRDKNEKEYLVWLLSSDFPQSLKDIIKRQQRLTAKATPGHTRTR